LETKRLNENSMHSDPSLDSMQRGTTLERLPAAAERLLEMTIERPEGKQKVISEMVFPSETSLKNAEEVIRVYEKIAATAKPPFDRVVNGPIEPLARFLSGPMIVDTFTEHKTGVEDDETRMGRREWRMFILRKRDPEAWEYTEQNNALRINQGVSTFLAAIEVIKNYAQPASPEGQAVLRRIVRNAEDLQEVLNLTQVAAFRDEGDMGEKIIEHIRLAGGYDRLPIEKKKEVVNLVRSLVFDAFKELAPYYASNADRSA